jgi:hypothetical protein
MLLDRGPRSDAALASMGLHRLRTRIRVMGIVKNVRVIRKCGMVVATAFLKPDLLLGMAVLLKRGDEALVVLVADEAWVIARWESDAFTSASTRCHTLVVIGITVCSATPRSLGDVRTHHEGVAYTWLTILRVANAYSLMKPWNHPKRIERGRYFKSAGFRRNKPTNLMTLVQHMNTI